ncbi:putative helicase senataxin [Aplochiton taeniatus]
MCRWCTPLGEDSADLLQRYWEGTLDPEEKSVVNDDLNYCLECVVEYHKRLYELETTRLLSRFSLASNEELEEDDLCVIENGQEFKVSKMTAAEFANTLRYPLSEILKYPYLMSHPKLSQMCVEAIDQMERSNPFQVFDDYTWKYPGIYLLLVHPNEQVRRWAIDVAKSQGVVDRDDFYDLQEIFESIFLVVELGMPENMCDLDMAYDPAHKMRTLPPHLYDRNEKNLWLGICMLLTLLDAQAMDSLFLGPDKTDVLQCIKRRLDCQDTQDPTDDPFWPALHCFMVILDRLGSRIWGGGIEPGPVFLAITENSSYKTEIENIRRETTQLKTEPGGDEDNGHADMVTCSQMVYNCNVRENRSKNTRRSSHGAAEGVVYEEMNSLVTYLQSDLGQAMRLHNSTFLWFIPFAKSVIDLSNPTHSHDVITHLCQEISRDVHRALACDKVTEFFTLILIHVMELHLSGGHTSHLYYSSRDWAEVLVTCATLPDTAFQSLDSHAVSSTSSSSSSRLAGARRTRPTSRAVPRAAMGLLRLLLKARSKRSPGGKCSRFLDLLNTQLRLSREGGAGEWSLSRPDVQDLKGVLKDVARQMMDAPGSGTGATAARSPSTDPQDSERGTAGPRGSTGARSPSTDPQDSERGTAGPRGSTGARSPSTDPQDSERGTAGPRGSTAAPPDVGVRVKREGAPAPACSPALEQERHDPAAEDGPQGPAPPPQFAALMPDMGKVHEIRSRLGQLMSHCKSGPNSRAAPDEECGEGRDTDSPGGESDDIPLSVLKKHLKTKVELGQINKNKEAVIVISGSDDSDATDIDEDTDDTGGRANERPLARVKIQSQYLDLTSDADGGPNGDCDGDLSESQLFEFETQQDVGAAWRGAEDEAAAAAETPGDPASPGRPAADGVASDTQPVSDEAILACRRAEEELGKPAVSSDSAAHGLKRAARPQKRNLLVEPRPLPSKWRGKTSLLEANERAEEPEPTPPQFVPPLPAGKGPAPPTRAARSKAPSAGAQNEAGPSVSAPPGARPPRGTPAVVPPRKVRQAPEPASTAERLGLKKRARKAFDLSQRSLDSVGKLRRYGQTVHVEKGRAGARKSGKTKKAPSAGVSGVGRSLPAQELQFLRQRKEKQLAAGAGGSGPRAAGSHPARQADRKSIGGAPHDDDDEEEEEEEERNDKEHERVEPEGEDDDDEDEDDDPLPASQPDPERVVSAPERTGGHPPSSRFPVDAEDGGDGGGLPPAPSGGQLALEQQVGEEEEEEEEEEEDDDWMQHSQHEVTDMEMCSQMEELEAEDFSHTQLDPLDMDMSDSQLPAEKGEPPDWTTPREKPSSPPPRVSSTGPHGDHLFLQPVPPASFKRPPTKVYATASSRSASLMQEMEKTPGAAGVAVLPAGRGRAARPTLGPARHPGPPPPASSLPVPPPPRAILKQYNSLVPGGRPPAILSATPNPASRPSGGKSVSFRPGTKEPTPAALQPPTYKTYPRPEDPVVKRAPASRLLLAAPDAHVKVDASVLIRDILKWDYGTWADPSSIGPPGEGTPKPVGVTIRSLEEYYQTFYPLVLLNTFAELASNWKKRTDANRFSLMVMESAHTNGTCTVTFTSRITAQQQQNQQHPKEEDVVVLWLPQNTEPPHSEPAACFGYVKKSVLVNRDDLVLSLTIQTRGSVTAATRQVVRCEQVGSLISTLREVRALCGLKDNPMRGPLLNNDLSFFTLSEQAPPGDRIPTGYNTDQQKAIRAAVSSVMSQRKVPKVCLIHGPPGTGKSKTIVGILETLFSEGPQSRAPANLNRQVVYIPMRVLICAPSNAAVDNLMKKVILVFKGKSSSSSPHGNCGDLNLIRLGSERSITESMKPYSLDAQIQKRTLKAPKQEQELLLRKAELEKDIEIISSLCANSPRGMPKYRNYAEEKERLLDARKKLSKDLKEVKEYSGKKQMIQAKVLQQSHVVFCTLSTSGSNLLASGIQSRGHQPFSCVIVDEAGQAKETETIIPLVFRCNSLVLVGDPEQLPPTVISQRAKELNFGQSLMNRLVKVLDQPCVRSGSPSPVVFLSVQYRMHPDICMFPSKHVYKSILQTDPATAEMRCAISWPFQSYRVYDVTDGREVKEGESYSNKKEVKLLVVLLKMIAESNPKNPVRVGVITPYRAQKDRILRELLRIAPCPTVDVNTVDGFQGREMECVIVSCVRASHEGGIGFLGDRERLNVTITRAKSSLFILGHLKTLSVDKDWKALIDDASKRGTIIKTEEKCFQSHARQIFKPDSLSRSLSYPSSSSSSSKAPPRPWPAAARGVPSPPAQRPPIKLRRSTIPLCSGPSAPSSSSPLQADEQPTDPRLEPRAPKPPPPPCPLPSDAPRGREGRWDPRERTRPSTSGAATRSGGPGPPRDPRRRSPPRLQAPPQTRGGHASSPRKRSSDTGWPSRPPKRDK